MFPRPSMKLLRKLSEKAVEITGCGLAGGLSLNFVGEKEMAAVNEAFVGHSGPTDVICFDYRESKSVLPDDNDGDTVEVEIVICPAVARREAQKRALPYACEVALYLAHGLLHAAGEDDLQPELKRKMRRREKKTMNELEKLFSFEDIFPEPVLTGDNTR